MNVGLVTLVIRGGSIASDRFGQYSITITSQGSTLALHDIRTGVSNQHASQQSLAKFTRDQLGEQNKDILKEVSNSLPEEMSVPHDGHVRPTVRSRKWWSITNDGQAKVGNA